MIMHCSALQKQLWSKVGVGLIFEIHYMRWGLSLKERGWGYYRNFKLTLFSKCPMFFTKYTLYFMN